MDITLNFSESSSLANLIAMGYQIFDIRQIKPQHQTLWVSAVMCVAGGVIAFGLFARQLCLIYHPALIT